MIRVDGEITETNASHVKKGSKSGKKCYVTLYDMDVGSLLANPEHMAKLSSLGQGSDIAAAKEVLKGLPGITVETEPTVKISFK